MATDRFDEDRGAVPFPLSYCLVCRAPLVVIVTREGSKFIQEIDCRICNQMKGKIYGRANSLLAEGTIALGDIKETFRLSFFLHHVEIELHHVQDLEFWTSVSM